MTRCARWLAMRKAPRWSSRSSAMVVCQATAIPISARRWLSHWLLVSRFWPLVNSLPTEMISAFMRLRNRIQKKNRRKTEETERRVSLFPLLSPVLAGSSLADDQDDEGTRLEGASAPLA